MKIIRMRATFGGLDHRELELKEGLNIIEAPNEGGKSTWSAFLRAMLYGINTKERDKQGYIAEKNRYQPWSGAAMEGVLELEWKGEKITLRRGPKGSTPFGKFEAVYTDTGEPVGFLTADNAGETLIGAPREVFERSAFVGQGARPSTAPPLWKPASPPWPPAGRRTCPAPRWSAACGTGSTAAGTTRPGLSPDWRRS